MRSLVFFIFLIMTTEITLAVTEDVLQTSVANGESEVVIEKENPLKLISLEFGFSQQQYTLGQQQLQQDSYSPSIQKNLASTFKYQDILLDAGFITAKSDYQNILIANDKGETRSLSKDFDKDEYLGSASVSTFIGSNNFSLGYSSSLSKTPFFQQGLQAEYYFRGPYDMYKLGLIYSLKKIDQPTNYFTNRDFVFTQRPEALTSNQTTIWYEQVFTDNFKTRFELLHGERPADRPAHNGAIIKSGYAFNNQFFLKSGLGYIAEVTAELKDNRGRFTSRFFDIESVYNHSYRFQASISYGLHIETEKNIFTSADTQIGHDIYSLNSIYKLNEYEISGNISYRESNIGTLETNLSGGLAWNL